MSSLDTENGRVMARNEMSLEHVRTLFGMAVSFPLLANLLLCYGKHKTRRAPRWPPG